LDSENKSDTFEFEIHRLKGRVALSNNTIKLLQGVREVFEMLDELDSTENTSTSKQQSEKGSKIVLIGRGLQWQDFDTSLRHHLELSDLPESPESPS
jgi:hypothetical protein